MAKIAQWRDSSRIPRFFGLDARACFPLLVFLLHIKLWSFILALAATVFFAALERYGFRLTVFLRWLRNRMAGNRKVSRSWWIS